jgi:hypothetical protein
MTSVTRRSRAPARGASPANDVSVGASVTASASTDVYGVARGIISSRMSRCQRRFRAFYAVRPCDAGHKAGA